MPITYHLTPASALFHTPSRHGVGRLLPASLLPREMHDPRLLALCSIRSSSPGFQMYLTQRLCHSIGVQEPGESPDTPPTTPGNDEFKHPEPCCAAPSLESFIAHVIYKSRCHTPTLLGMLVLLERLRLRMPEQARAGIPSTRHRVFLALLILAAKAFNDASPAIQFWHHYAEEIMPLSMNDVAACERQALQLLEYDVSITDAELHAVASPLYAHVRIVPSTPSPSPAPRRAATTTPRRQRPSPLKLHPHPHPQEYATPLPTPPPSAKTARSIASRMRSAVSLQRATGAA